MEIIKTLQQLADFINSEDYNQLVVNEVIKQNGWEDLSADTYDVCAFNGRKVTLDENTAEAKVVDL